MPLPTSYATDDSIDASTDPHGGGGINGWMTAINSNTSNISSNTAAIATKAATLVPTTTKTSAYTAAANEFVIVDASSGSPVITLPTAPADGASVAVKRHDATYAAANAPTVAPGGSDAFLGGGVTPLRLVLQDQVFVLQYNTARTQWIVRSTDEPLSGLDARYSAPGVDVRTYGAKCDGKVSYEATISGGSLNTVACADQSFTSADVGKTIVIGGQWNFADPVTPAGSVAHEALVTTIASVSSGHAILTTPATHAVTGVQVVWGADDGAAWVSALTATVTNGGELIMPAGISICSQSTSLAPTGGDTMFSLRGSTDGTSWIVSTAAGGFLTLDTTHERISGLGSNIRVSDLAFFAARAGNTHALSFTEFGESGTTNRHGVIIEKVICGSFDSAVGYWDKAIEVIGFFRPILRDVLVFGLPNYQPTPGTGDFTDTSVMYLPTCGISMNNSYIMKLINVEVYRCFRGIQVIAEALNGISDVYLDTCSIESCREGLYIDASDYVGGNRGLNLRGSFFDNRDFNMFVRGKQAGNISHSQWWTTPQGWAPTSTLATAVTTGSTPTTLTLASTTNFPRVGAVQIDSEWFTYDNRSSGMDGTTLNNVVRAQFGTADPGSSHTVGATVHVSASDILMMNNTALIVDNNVFIGTTPTCHFSVMLHSGGTTGTSITGNYFTTGGTAVAVGKDSAAQWVYGNIVPSGTNPILDGAHTTTTYAAIVDLAPTVIKTSNYTAGLGELVTVGAFSGAVAVQLPTQPPALTHIGVHRVDGTANAVTINCGGADVFHVGTSGITSLSVPLGYQSIVLEYIGGVWSPIGGNLPLDDLDVRYPKWSGGTVGVLPATSGQHLSTQGGSILDDGSGNVLIKAAAGLKTSSAPPPTAGQGYLYFASDGLHFIGPTTDTLIAPA